MDQIPILAKRTHMFLMTTSLIKQNFQSWATMKAVLTGVFVGGLVLATALLSTSSQAAPAPQVCCGATIGGGISRHRTKGD